MPARGFIGPIGDDLPSLIPLLFALVVFFSTFAFAFGVFEARSRDFQHDLKALQLAHALKANGYVGSAAEFRERCTSLGISGMKYRAFVTDVYARAGATATGAVPGGGISAGGSQGTGVTAGTQGIADSTSGTSSTDGTAAEPALLDIYGLDAFSLGDAALECTNAEERLTNESALQTTVVVKVYPIAVEDNMIVKPMHLVVIAWR